MTCKGRATDIACQGQARIQETRAQASGIGSGRGVLQEEERSCPCVEDMMGGGREGQSCCSGDGYGGVVCATQMCFRVNMYGDRGARGGTKGSCMRDSVGAGVRVQAVYSGSAYHPSPHRSCGTHTLRRLG